MLAIENRYLKPLPLLIIGLVAGAILLYVGSLIAAARDENAFGLAAQSAFGAGGWATWLIIGAIIVYVLYVFVADRPIWGVGTREVVYMALGAALYGLLSWVFNTIPVPSVSLVSLRPTVVIPIFFGFAFGPVVGFFTGFMGNILGDALTGWGVFPVWDIGNGLMGLIPGLVLAFKDRDRAWNVLFWVTVALLAIAAALPLISPNINDPFSGDPANFGGWWWVPAAGVVLLLVTNFAPRSWPVLMGLLVIGVVVRAVASLVTDGFSGGVLVLFLLAIVAAALAWYLFRRREAIAEALSDEDTKTICIWGTLGVIVGIGFAALADIFINGYTFFVAFVGEFVPAAGPNILFAILLTPLLYGAWRQTQAQTGR
ncbi:MAG: ECF transporter S component [Anaerolineae bacterium]